MKILYIKNIYFCISSLILLCSCSLPEINDFTRQEASNKVSSTENLNANTEDDFLDFGLYWFNANNKSFKGFNESKNKAIEVSLDLYNPTKPTVIYFHGWSIGSSENNYVRENFQLTNNRLNINVNTVSAWKKKGWNVAIFYWNQFSDENNVNDAEAKIWSASGPKKMRYRLKNGKYSNSESPNSSVSELAYNQLKTVLLNNSSNNIRIVGHSLGSQLAVNVSYLISKSVKSGELTSAILPNRIELLDPYWSRGAKSFLGDYNNDGSNDWTGERTRFYIEQIKAENNSVFTWHKSSALLNLGLGDNNEKLKKEVAFQSFRPWYLNSLNLGDKHIYVRHNYFWSMSFDAPKEVKLDFFRRRSYTGKNAASASTSNARIKNLMNSGYLWDHVEGRRSVTPEDDKFEIKKW